MADSARVKSRVFWSGGSQAVRVPKALRLRTEEVTVERRGEGLLVSPVTARDDWDGFWDQLVPLRAPVKRWKTKSVEKRRSL